MAPGSAEDRIAQHQEGASLLLLGLLPEPDTGLPCHSWTEVIGGMVKNKQTEGCEEAAGDVSVSGSG